MLALWARIWIQIGVTGERERQWWLGWERKWDPGERLGVSYSWGSTSGHNWTRQIVSHTGPIMSSPSVLHKNFLFIFSSLSWSVLEIRAICLSHYLNLSIICTLPKYYIQQKILTRCFQQLTNVCMRQIKQCWLVHIDRWTKGFFSDGNN